MSLIRVWTVIVAAGRGDRFGGPKQLAPLAGRRIVDRALDTALEVSDGVVLVAAADQRDELIGDRPDTVRCVRGGASRSASVRAGLAEVPDDADAVLVHDGARPLASTALFERVIARLCEGAEAVVPAVAVTDTIRRVDGGVIDRNELVAVQTPQGFGADRLRRAHASGAEATDDAALVEADGGMVELVDGESTNIKITDQHDLVVAEALLRAMR